MLGRQHFFSSRSVASSGGCFPLTFVLPVALACLPGEGAVPGALAAGAAGCGDGGVLAGRRLVEEDYAGLGSGFPGRCA